MNFVRVECTWTLWGGKTAFVRGNCALPVLRKDGASSGSRFYNSHAANEPFFMEKTLKRTVVSGQILLCLEAVNTGGLVNYM